MFFVIIALFLFMGFQNSVLVGIAIPLSMLMSFIILSFVGLELNFIVLFSLILSLGMLVDNAIVVVENIYRHVQGGKTRIEAAKVGIGEVAYPVISSTLTTLAAFFSYPFYARYYWTVYEVFTINTNYNPFFFFVCSTVF